MHHTNTIPMTPVMKPVNDIITEVVNEANALIAVVTNDYNIDAETGVILGKRQKPSLTGKQEFEVGPIGYVAAGDQGVGTAAQYYKTEPFMQRIENIHYLSIQNLEEKIANLKKPTLPITDYQPIVVASVLEGLFLDALAVVLSERGFYVEVNPVPNNLNPAARHREFDAPFGNNWNVRPVPLRNTREQFIEGWTRMLTAPQSWGYYGNGSNYTPAIEQLNQLPVQEVDNQADDSANQQ